MPLRLMERLFAFVPYRLVVLLGSLLGTLSYYLMPNQRRRVMNSLGCASDLQLNEAEMKRVARASLRHLHIVTLDYLKMRRRRGRLADWLVCDNPEDIEHLHQQVGGLVLLTGHLGNWELTIADASSRLKGRVISQRFFVSAVADWVDELRCQYGAQLMGPQQAVSQGLQALHGGEFAGIAGDQALPESSWHFPFLGTRAWTSVTPALWARRSGKPVVLVTAIRQGTRYRAHYGEPVWPQPQLPFREDIRRMTLELIKQLEQLIRQHPQQYLWMHSRWRQHVYQGINKPCQHDFIRVILPADVEQARTIWPQLAVLAQLYPRGFITVMKPQGLNEAAVLFSDAAALQIEEQIFHNAEQMRVRDWRTQMVLNFSGCSQTGRFYRRLAAFKVLDFPADSGSEAAEIIRQAVADGSGLTG